MPQASKNQALCIIVGLLIATFAFLSQVTGYVEKVSIAEVKAAAAFAAQHLFDQKLSVKLAAYNDAVELSKSKNRPSPGWQLTACEQQSLDARDYTINVASRKVAAPWPTSGLLKRKTMPAPAPFTPLCQVERQLVADGATLHEPLPAQL